MSEEPAEGCDGTMTPGRFVWRARIRANPTAYLIYRAVVAVVGLIVIAVGVVLLPLPGPGWLIIFIGIGVWATEFAWARGLLRFTRGKVRLWTVWMGRQGWFVRGLVGLGVMLLVAACFWLVFLVSGVPGFLPGQVKEWLVRVPGL